MKVSVVIFAPPAHRDDIPAGLRTIAADEMQTWLSISP
jgi:hypothetical protein